MQVYMDATGNKKKKNTESKFHGSKETRNNQYRSIFLLKTVLLSASGAFGFPSQALY
jgi:hypothetical protein